MDVRAGEGKKQLVVVYVAVIGEYLGCDYRARDLVYNKNRTGPRTGTLGTPVSRGQGLDRGQGVHCVKGHRQVKKDEHTQPGRWERRSCWSGGKWTKRVEVGGERGSQS